MSTYLLIFKYIGFAIIATFVNLCIQRIIISYCFQDYSFSLAMFIGTISGLIIKFLLDKRWIFYDKISNLEKNALKLSLYSLMGCITTVIFWSFETIFWLIWHTNQMREYGAILGLIIGYFIKYHLDKRYVFTALALKREVFK